ncbi:RagB/SusD family nutrient uptake outer membrane protein [Fulvivirga ligni]|uniref:RagB/SusD family nutrient uptake outer membrane protein n=1 Tax=Fulvivirga ligni TaxID=2904246 RepID=UPI001F3D09B4|nr:RagB/SusD family nutrient uptake outer membrane protein [Fulvivirga ligni]UII19008.1 RagB/SusD family nutrient uptake outer membrane protein [Fulvivirga ligni]
MKFIFERYHKILCLGLSMILLAACSDEFLEIIPKGRLIAEKEVDYDKMLYNLDLVNIRTANAQVPLGAEMIAFEPNISSSALRTQRLYNWEGLIYEDEENAGELELPMENLYIYNKIINEVLDATEGTEQKKLSIYAEARAGRAWTYFLLINYYGLPYNEETSSTDLGFPLLEEANLIAGNFTRASVTDIYQLIVDDLETAIPNLPTIVESRFRFTRAAGKALLGKVYTFMGKFEQASSFLEQALVEMPDVGIDAHLMDYNQGYSSQRVDTDPESLYGKQFINNWANTSSELTIKPEVMSLYSESDLRLQYLYQPAATDGNAYPLENTYRKRTGSGQTAFGIRVQDVYLLNAEVKCRNNDISGAVETLEYFRSHRMPEEDAAVPADIASDQEALLRFIFDERLREFAGLGFYWFDMRRLTVDPMIPTLVSSFTHTIYNADGIVQSEYQLTEERLVLRFPQTVMDQNPNLINND